MKRQRRRKLKLRRAFKEEEGKWIKRKKKDKPKKAERKEAEKMQTKRVRNLDRHSKTQKEGMSPFTVQLRGRCVGHMMITKLNI
jgi:ribosomal protein L34E